MIISASDLSGRLLEPVIARPRRPLSNSASTDSCSIRFSLRTIISGAARSNRRFKRLLRLITRRYRSFRSDVAKRPPSSGTNGRRSGGSTGSTFMIIHSGLLPEIANASINLRRLVIFLRLVSELVDSNSSRICSMSWFRFRSCSKASTASAPIFASNSSPHSSRLSRYCSSVSIMPRSSAVIPGSITTYDSK